ncbi:MAG: sigma-54 dependent transcriptional regulator [Polyangiaceae bacterium]
MTVRALVADDDDGVRFTLTGLLEDEGLEVEAVRDGAEALDFVRRARPHLILSDLRMPKLDGLELLRALASEGLLDEVAGSRFVLITAHGSERHAVEAIKLGAYDYFRKPFDNDEVLAIVRKVVEAVALREKNDRLESELLLSRDLLFASEPMARLATLVRRVAARDITILLNGESGTGKERIAEAIAGASSRKDKPFVRFNCASLTRELAEAELFGHAKGAFTGAHAPRIGLFRQANGGTLLLDEIGELPLDVQAKLLRVLQEGELRPVGEDRVEKVDVRVIAATHRDLAELVRQGSFREDLYYRLKVVELVVPPLRERRADIPLLAREFLRRAADRFGVPRVAPTPALFAALEAHGWPGNVRELENAIDSLVALSPEGELDLSNLPFGSPRTSAPADDDNEPLKRRVEAYERGLLVAALAAASQNRTEAARALRIGRATLHEKLRKYGLG